MYFLIPENVVILTLPSPHGLSEASAIFKAQTQTRRDQERPCWGPSVRYPRLTPGGQLSPNERLWWPVKFQSGVEMALEAGQVFTSILAPEKKGLHAFLHTPCPSCSPALHPRPGTAALHLVALAMKAASCFTTQEPRFSPCPAPSLPPSFPRFMNEWLNKRVVKRTTPRDKGSTCILLRTADDLFFS